MDCNGSIEYKVIRSKRRTLALLVDKNGGVVVKAPLFMPERAIDSFVRKNTAFIEKHRKKAFAEVDGAMRLGAYTAEDVARMKKRAKEVFPEAVRHYADLLGVKPGKITVRRQTTRWGSCSANGNISLNLLLCDCPERVMLSVVAHEVCHLKVRNHGKDFYALLYGIFPDYDSCRKWLNGNGGVLNKRYEMYLEGTGRESH